MEIWGALCPYGTYSVQSPENHTPMPLFRRSIPVIWLLAFGLLMIPQASARLYISEFLADNNDGLLDSDGDPSDWIELFNSGSDAIQLGGYYLTDNPSSLTKWPFPSLQLEPRQFLVVFASGKDRRDPGGQLHANFKIDSRGEYLGLIAPDGISVVSDFGRIDALPRQRENVSYGLMQSGTSTSRTLLSQNTQATVRIPTAADSALGTSWTEPSFDDSGWLDVAIGVGYDEDSTYIPEFGVGGNLGEELNGVNTSLYLRIPFQLTEASSVSELSLRMKYDDGFAAYLNGELIESANSPAEGDLSYDSEATSNHSDSEALVYQSFDLNNRIQLLRNGTNILAIHGLNDGLNSSDMLISPELNSVQITNPETGAPGFFSSPTPGAQNGESFAGFVEDPAFSVDRGFFTDQFQLQLSTVTDGAEIRYTLDGSPPSPNRGLIYSGPVSIAGTQVVRAMAHKAGFQPTNVATQTYIFPDDVASQTRPSGYPTSWGGEPRADYDMDTQITRSRQYSARLQRGLRDIPTLSVTGEADDFFGPNGIYVDTQNRSIEASVSAEYFHPDPTNDGVNIEGGFQIDCGVKLQGGASRNPGSSIKHSLSLRFRDLYGPGKLNYPVFEGTSVTTFDSIHLRAMYNNSWHHSNSGQRARATMIRDQWARDCMIAMGNADGGHGHFVHLYLNGLYWGVYNLHERLENDHYAAYNGFEDNEVLGLNPGRLTSEESSSFNSMKSLVANTRTTWARIQRVIDVDNYIDFVIAEYFGRNADLKNNDNWRAAGGGAANAPWRFYCWDTERILEDETNTSAPSNSGALDGALIFDDLERFREFRVRFADRAYKHLFHGGALTNLANRNRFQKYADQIDTAIICESARWGDDRSGGGSNGNYTRDENWTRAVYGTPGGPGTSPGNGVLGSWFPTSGTNRTDRMISTWRSRRFSGTSDTYLGTIQPPLFTVNGGTQHGGDIPTGGTLSATASSGSIYYTTDGTDPRLEGGNLSPGAILLSGQITLPSSGLVRMRARVGGGDSWSPLSEALFYLERRATASDLRITEINYNAVPASALEARDGANLSVPRLFGGGDFEFIEISNVSDSAVTLNGVQFTDGITFTFPVINLQPAGYVVIVADLEGFETRYGTGLPVAGQYSGALNNGGERISLVTSDGSSIQDFVYDDGGTWPGRADGIGSSLEVIDPASDYDNSENWRSSSEYNGSPGASGAGPDGRIVINEVLTNTDLPALDRIELHNTTTSSIEVMNWYLSDASGNYRKFRIPTGSIPAGGYMTWDENDFNAPEDLRISSYAGSDASAPTTVFRPGHGLSTGDVITISGYAGTGAYNGTFEITATGPDSFTIPAAFIDNHGTKGAYTRGEPFALSAQGDKVWLLEGNAQGHLLRFVDVVEFAAARASEALGRWPNGGGSETLVSMTAATLGAMNAPAQVGPVIISEVMYHPVATPENSFEYVELFNPGPAIENLANWRIRGGVDFDFTADHSLNTGETILVVGFDPVTDLISSTNFRSHYGIGTEVPLLGPWNDGPLRNDQGIVRLQRPDMPPPTDPELYPQVTEDEVRYLATAPWPTGPDGNGGSLHRVDSSLFGNFSSSWTGETPSPGTGAAEISYADFRELTFGPGSPPGSSELEDFDLDGFLNIVEYALGLNPLLADASLAPSPVVEGGELTLTFPSNPLLSDVRSIVEFSTDLVTWTPLGDVAVPTGNSSGLRKASITMAPYERLFLRISVTSIP